MKIYYFLLCIPYSIPKVGKYYVEYPLNSNFPEEIVHRGGFPSPLIYLVSCLEFLSAVTIFLFEKGFWLVVSPRLLGHWYVFMCVCVCLKRVPSQCDWTSIASCASNRAKKFKVQKVCLFVYGQILTQKIIKISKKNLYC